jgi:cell division protein FtsB
VKTKKKVTSSRGPRPIVAFAASLAVSSILMGFLLLSDRRVLELRRARVEVRTLDHDIAEKRRENEELRAAIDAANRHEFPAEKVAREELNLVQPDEVVLLYPPGGLTNSTRKPPSAPTPNPSAAPEPRP